VKGLEAHKVSHHFTTHRLHNYIHTFYTD